jgi:subtilisin family serine protease
MNRFASLLFLLALTARPTHTFALDDAVPAVNGHISRTLLGDGTGVRLAIIDSGVDDTHPALTGADSLGNPRMIAESNFVTTEPGNTGDDIFGHGTWVASAALSRHLSFNGVASDARFINARVLDNNNGFANDVQVRNGIGFAIGQNADILNLSLNFFGAVSNGTSQLDLIFVLKRRFGN